MSNAKVLKYLSTFIMTIFIFISSSYFLCWGSVSKEMLVAKTSEQIQVYYSTNTELQAGAKKIISRRIERVRKAIQSLPEENIDDELAEWIRHSVILTVTLLPFGFNDTDAYNLEKTYLSTMEDRLKNLTNAKGRNLLLTKNKLIQSSNAYRSSLTFYIVNEMSSFKKIKLWVSKSLSLQG